MPRMLEDSFFLIAIASPISNMGSGPKKLICEQVIVK